MITAIADFLRYFEGVHRRTVRDIDALPPEGGAWTPPAGEGELAWGISELAGHIARSRSFFLGAYRAEDWIMRPAGDTADTTKWAALLEESAAAHSTGRETTPGD